jgi:hypothetical protein
VSNTYKNLYGTTLVNNLDAISTSFDVVSLTGAPSAVGENFFFVGLQRQSDGLTEIVKVTDVTSNTFTVERNVDGRGALNFLAGDQVEGRITAETMEIMHNRLLQDTGAANAYAITSPFPYTSYFTGTTVKFEASFANTGPCTLALNGMGAVPLEFIEGSLITGDILVGSIIEATYNGAEFIIASGRNTGLLSVSTSAPVSGDGTGGDPITVADNTLANSKLEQVSDSTVKGRAAGAGVGNVQDLSPAQVRTIINVEDGATADQSDAEIETAYNNQVPQVTAPEKTSGTETAVRRFSPEDIADMAGDHALVDTATPVSGDGSAGTPITIADNQITNSKIETMDQALIKGRASGAGTGNQTDLTPAQVRTIINVEDGATADQTDAEIETAYNNQVAQVSAGEKTAGTESAVRRFSPLDIADMAGDHATVTTSAPVSGDGSGGSPVTIADGAVGNAKLVDMDADRIKGRANGAGTGDQTDLTPAQVRTIINVEDGATADQTDAEIETAYNNQVPQVSGPEKTAGTETAIRRYSPQDIADMAGTHGGGGGGVPTNLSWTFSSTTTDADPGPGLFRLNNASMASVTEMYIDDLAQSGADATEVIELWSQGVRIYMGQTDDDTAGALFEVTGIPVDNSGYYRVPITHIGDATTGLTNTNVYGFQIVGSSGGTSTAGNGIPTEEYRADSPAGLGLATTSNLVYFTNVRDNTISQFGTITNDSTDGWTFTASRECEVVLSGSLGFGGGVASFGFTYNEVPGDKNLGIGSLSAGKHLGFTSANVAGWARNAAANKILQPNDVIKFHTENNEVPYTNAQFGLQMTVRDVGGGAAGGVIEKEFGFALSDETSDLAVGDGKLEVSWPVDMTVTAIRAYVTTAPVGDVVNIDIEKNAVTVFSTTLTIDAGENTSETAAVPAVISAPDWLAEDVIKFNIDTVGSSTAGAGLKIWVAGYVPGSGFVVIKIDDTDSPYTASPGEIIIADTTSGAITVVVPGTPAIGDLPFSVQDAEDTWATNNVTIDRNSLTINGTAADDTLDVNGLKAEYVANSGSDYRRVFI